MAKEPVLGYREAWMSFEGLDEQISLPNTYRSMGKSGRADLPSKSALQTANLILYILGLLTQGSFAAVRPNTLNRVSNTQCFAPYSVGNYWEVRR